MHNQMDQLVTSQTDIYFVSKQELKGTDVIPTPQIAGKLIQQIMEGVNSLRKDYINQEKFDKKEGRRALGLYVWSRSVQEGLAIDLR